jgi:hypothetical protein
MNMLELTPDREPLTPEQIQNLGKPLSPKPHISDFEFKCDKCLADGFKSIVSFITEPYFKMWRMPYWDDGVYTAGIIKWFFHVRCKNDHEYTITKDVATAFDVDGLINEDSASEGEWASMESKKEEAESKEPKHHHINLMERVPVGDGGKEEPKDSWDSEVK